MQYEFLKQGLDILGKTHFQKTWPDDSVKVMAMEVADIHDKAMVTTIARARVEISPATFPALKRIIDLLREEQVKINLSNSPAEASPRRVNDATPVLNRSSLGQLGMDSIRLIDALFDGKLSRENFIEGMMVFDKKYPHIGWGEQAASLAAYYSSQERVDTSADMS